MPKKSSAKKRKMEDGNSRNIPPIASDTSNGNLSLSIMSSVGRATSQAIGQQPPHVVHSHLPTPPPTLTSSGGNGAMTAVARNDAMEALEDKKLDLESLKLELEIKKIEIKKKELEIKMLERKCGVDTRVNSPIDEQDD